MDMTLSDYDGRTALHLAAAEGHLDCVQFMLEQCGVSSNPKDRWLWKFSINVLIQFNFTLCRWLFLSVKGYQICSDFKRRYSSNFFLVILQVIFLCVCNLVRFAANLISFIICIFSTSRFSFDRPLHLYQVCVTFLVCLFLSGRL